MKNKPYKLISVLISAILFISIMPFNNVKADTNPTYAILETGNCQNVGTSGQYYIFVGNNSDVRAAFVKKSSDGWGYLYLVSTSSFKSYYGTYSNNACSMTSNNYSNAQSTSYGGVTYYYAQYGSFYNLSTSTVPLNITNLSSSDVNTGIRYTYGDKSIDPEPPAPPIQAGDLTFNYYTDFASTQQYTIGALKSNRDTITWSYDSTDSNIELLDLKVDIRAVPNNYYSSTESGLVSLGWGDIHLDVSYSSDLGSYQINNNQVSYTWEEVVNNFKTQTNLPSYFDTVINFWSNGFYKFYNNQYYAAGWVYQIRLNTWSGDYTGEWQTIYTVPSSPPEGQQTTIEYYVNGTGMTEPVYQNIQNINNQNNITNNNWYVNGSPYGIDDSTGSNWWETLLQFISDLVSTILSFLGSIFDSVITGVLELVNNLGINFLEVFSNLINRIVELFGNIDLTGENYLIPEEYTENLNTFHVWTTGLFNVFINSGLGLLVFIPFILLIVRLFL